jgi:hypothetical protein
MGCIVDKYIDATKFADSVLDDGAAMLGTTNVAGDQDSPTPLLLNQRLDLLRIVVLDQIGDQDVGTFARIGDCHGTSNAAVAARNYSSHAFQLT